MGVSVRRVALVDVADIEGRLGGQELSPFQRDLLLGVFGLGQPRRLGRPQQLQRLPEHRSLHLGLLVALLGLLDEVGHALLEAIEVGQHQLGLDRLRVGDRVDPALDMGHVAAFEAAQHMDDRVHLADVRQELVAQPFALGGAAHEARNVDELELRLDDRLRSRDARDLVQPRVGHGHAPDVRLDRAEGIIGRLRRRRLRQGIEEGGLAHIGKPHDPAPKTHSVLPILMLRAALAIRRRGHQLWVIVRSCARCGSL